MMFCQDEPFKGGVWKAESVCRLHAKALASTQVCHLKAVTVYYDALFDAAMEDLPSEAFRLVARVMLFDVGSVH